MMKYFFTLLSLTFLLLTPPISSAQNWSEERAVKATADISKQDAKITLSWESSTYADSYIIHRRDLDATSWGSAIATLASDASSYEDNNIELNKRYEYRITRRTTLTEPFSNTGAKMEAHGFIVSGIDIAPLHYRGRILVLVSQDLMTPLSTELNALYFDLLGDGYQAEVVSVATTSSVSDVSDIISSKSDLKTIYLIGNVAYPYSGLYCHPQKYEVPPDGHNENAGGHCGAWIADAYYGSIGANWTDTDSTTIASRDDNDNLIDDGKFDNNQLPGVVTIEVGRADLSRLNKFTLTDIQLTARYLNKVHDYKHHNQTYIEEAIVENNFSSFEEGFSSAALRDFHSHLGPGKTTNSDLFTATRNDDYLFSYTCGAGSYTSCNGVGRTDSFVVNNAAAFNHMFGSYFGDHDISNNISRASLGTPKGGLVSAWSGRPKWITHGLAMGENYGKVAMRTQNNDWGYDLSFYQNYAHISLLGDPTLRTSVVAPPTNLYLATNQAETEVYLGWTASVDDVTGYYIYWSTDQEGGYVLLNETPVTTAAYNHYTPANGDNYYMIRAEKLEQTASGSYYNLSQGDFISVSGIKRTVNVTDLRRSTVAIYPVPATNIVNVRMPSNALKNAYISNAIGQIVMDQLEVTDGTAIDVSHLPSGVYHLHLEGNSSKFIKL